jgi:hypothetical protein
MFLDRHNDLNDLFSGTIDELPDGNFFVPTRMGIPVWENWSVDN